MIEATPSVVRGGAGNRTRVLRRFDRTSPSAARYVVLGPLNLTSELRRRAQSQLISPHRPRDRICLASLLADAGELGRRHSQTDDFTYRLGSESEVSAIVIGAYCFPTTINEATLASSARFPYRNVQSRNLSPPKGATAH